jgi:hypothetical protein
MGFPFADSSDFMVLLCGSHGASPYIATAYSVFHLVKNPQ